MIIINLLIISKFPTYRFDEFIHLLGRVFAHFRQDVFYHSLNVRFFLEIVLVPVLDQWPQFCEIGLNFGHLMQS